ncbi:tetratricopeptide repeat protein [Rickettsia koreansis]
MGKYNLVLESYNKAIELDPTNSEVQYNKQHY